MVTIDPLTVTETDRNQTAQVTFRLDGPSAATTRVRYVTEDGTAVRNQDFNRRAGTVTFRPGETLKTIPLVIRGDRNHEPTEQLTIRMFSPTGLQTGPDGVVTIEDNDVPGPTASVVSRSVTETDRSQSVQITVELDRAPTATVRVRYETVAGSATRNRDYTHRAGTITFRTGETAKTATVVVRGDRVAESTESFTIALSNPTGLQLGSDGVITIADND